jgi:CrcB protein
VTWLLVVFAGAAGTAARYGIGLAIGPRAFPWATLGINVSGSFLIGVALTAATARLGPQAATALAVGFLGAFTTYSTFAWETFTLGRTDRILLAACYLTASVVLGVLSAALGHRLGQVLMQ